MQRWYILNAVITMEMSSVSASDYLRNHGIEVSKSVICELIKKKRLR